MILATSTGESLFQLLVMFVIFIAVLFVTYYVTKWIAGYQKAGTWNRNLKIVETIKVSSNKVVEIIEAGQNKYFVIAVGKDEITLLGTLDKEDLKPEASDLSVNPDSGVGSFQDVLSRLKDTMPGAKNKKDE
ncbi:MAG: flagellar biosynthetic protein FliO [Lachnospiraceae bacterium]|nr:flagellar biosynthetic protein FliO [Lachnospiraceae bacterium]